MTCCITKDQQNIIAGLWDNSIRVYNFDGQEVKRIDGHREKVSCVECTKDGLIYSASYDGTVRIWKLKTGKEKTCLEGHSGSVLALALNKKEENILMTGGYDKSVRIWNSKNKKQLKILEHH